jgi:hypothetical protein
MPEFQQGVTYYLAVKAYNSRGTESGFSEELSVQIDAEGMKTTTTYRDDDSDDDGIINLLDYDSDDDGLSDLSEYNHGTDPSNQASSLSKAIKLSYGNGQIYTMMPAEGHHLADILVNGESIGASESFILKDIPLQMFWWMVNRSEPCRSMRLPT